MKHKLLLIILTSLGLLVLSAVLIKVNFTQKNSISNVEQSTSTDKTASNSAAVKAGNGLSSGKCSGEGSTELTHLPMDEADFGVILPYGLMVGGHVTPIDHQYFTPREQNSARDAYPVYAMGDATITDIQPRTDNRGTEYRFVFTISCTYFYYYDLVTELASDIKAIYDEKQRGSFEIKVSAGQEIGRIGGQTLDFAVWDTTKPLKHFVEPDSYKGESWKIYTVDPLDYYTAELKTKALAKYARFVEPRSGRIDYDIDGKLVGNWFKKDSGGYAGPTGNTGPTSYWKGHLAIVPDYLDPTATMFSIGEWDGGEASQFVVPAAIDPSTVGIETGLVKYELYQGTLTTPDGQAFMGAKPVEGIKMKPFQEVRGCVLLQLIELRLLKLESFPKKNCSTISAFTDAASKYIR